MEDIIEYLKTVESATIEELYLWSGDHYYHNGHKYISEIMSRLVKRGLVIRIKKGVFKIAPNVKKVNGIYPISATSNFYEIKLLQRDENNEYNLIRVTEYQLKDFIEMLNELQKEINIKKERN